MSDDVIEIEEDDGKDGSEYPQGAYSRVARDADLDVVLRMCATFFSNEIAGTTNDNIFHRAEEMLSYWKYGPKAAKVKNIREVKKDGPSEPKNPNS